jgi:hypothetical protein
MITIVLPITFYYEYRDVRREQREQRERNSEQDKFINSLNTADFSPLDF